VNGARTTTLQIKLTFANITISEYFTRPSLFTLNIPVHKGTFSSVNNSLKRHIR